MAYGNVSAALSAFQVIRAGNAEQCNGISGFKRQNTAVVFQKNLPSAAALRAMGYTQVTNIGGINSYQGKVEYPA